MLENVFLQTQVNMQLVSVRRHSGTMSWEFTDKDEDGWRVKCIDETLSKNSSRLGCNRRACGNGQRMFETIALTQFPSLSNSLKNCSVPSEKLVNAEVH